MKKINILIILMFFCNSFSFSQYELLQRASDIAPTLMFTEVSTYDDSLWGDWIITGIDTVQNVTIFLHGNLIIENGGSLTLRKVTLIIDCSYENEYGIFANAGSSLLIYDSSIKPSAQNHNFLFEIVYAQLILKNNEIQGVGEPWDGIQIQAEGAIVEDNIIYHGESSGIKLTDGSRDALIRRNVIHNIIIERDEEVGPGINLHGSHNNQITENYLKYQRHPISINHSWNNLVADNEITLKSASTGIVVQTGSGNNIISNNRITKDPTANIA